MRCCIRVHTEGHMQNPLHQRMHPHWLCIVLHRRPTHILYCSYREVSLAHCRSSSGSIRHFSNHKNAPHNCADPVPETDLLGNCIDMTRKCCCRYRNTCRYLLNTHQCQHSVVQILIACSWHHFRKSTGHHYRWTDIHGSQVYSLGLGICMYVCPGSE